MSRRAREILSVVSGIALMVAIHYSLWFVVAIPAYGLLQWWDGLKSGLEIK